VKDYWLECMWYVDPTNKVLLSKTQQDEAKSTFCDLAVMIFGLATASSQDSDSNVTNV